MIVIFNLSSVAYVLVFTCYIYTLKYDISYLLMSLNARPELEFFVNLDDEEEKLIGKD